MMAASAESSTLERNCCVCGYHIYHSIWDVTVGEELLCERKLTNLHDRYAIAVIKDENVIGHLPQKISCVCSLFLQRGGSIICRVIGTRRYSADLPQGGLEIPCTSLFEAKIKEIKKL